MLHNTNHRHLSGTNTLERRYFAHVINPDQISYDQNVCPMKVTFKMSLYGEYVKRGVHNQDQMIQDHMMPLPGSASPVVSSRT